MLVNRKAITEENNDTNEERLINAVLKWRDVIKDEYSSNQEMRYAEEQLVEAVED